MLFKASSDFPAHELCRSARERMSVFHSSKTPVLSYLVSDIWS
jgi:hypothetical protein